MQPKQTNVKILIPALHLAWPLSSILRQFHASPLKIEKKTNYKLEKLV